ETPLRAQLAAFREKAAQSRCPLIKGLEFEVNSLVDDELVPGYTLYEGDELRFTVERMGSSGPPRTWRFTVRAEAPRLDWAYANEEAWIVGQTSRDIVEMILYARDHALPPASALAFSVKSDSGAGQPLRYTVSVAPPRVTPLEQPLTFDTHIWAPASYAPV